MPSIDVSPSGSAMGKSTHRSIEVTIAGTVFDAAAHGSYSALTADDHTQYVLDSLADAKGDILVATADDTITIIAVGANNTLLRAASGASPGVAWS